VLRFGDKTCVPEESETKKKNLKVKKRNLKMFWRVDMKRKTIRSHLLRKSSKTFDMTSSQVIFSFVFSLSLITKLVKKI
jgi:hypothetical protein